MTNKLGVRCKEGNCNAQATPAAAAAPNTVSSLSVAVDASDISFTKATNEEGAWQMNVRFRRGKTAREASM